MEQLPDPMHATVFVAVNEKGQAGESMRVAHERELYRELLAR